MRAAAQQAVQAYAVSGAMLVVMESFVRRVVNSRDHTDVVIASGIALDEIELIKEGAFGQVVGKCENCVVKPI